MSWKCFVLNYYKHIDLSPTLPLCLYTSSKGQHLRTLFWLNENAGRDKSWPEDLPMQRRLKKPTKTNWKTMFFAGIEAVLSDTFNVLKWRKHNHTFSLIVTFGFQDWFKTLLKSLFKILLKKICEDYLKSIFLSLLKKSWRTLHWQLISIQIIIV